MSEDISARVPGPEPRPEPIKYNPQVDGVVSGFKYCRKFANKLPEDAKFFDKCGSRTDY